MDSIESFVEVMTDQPGVYAGKYVFSTKGLWFVQHQKDSLISKAAQEMYDILKTELVKLTNTQPSEKNEVATWKLSDGLTFQISMKEQIHMDDAGSYYVEQDKRSRKYYRVSMEVTNDKYFVPPGENPNLIQKKMD